MAPLNERHSDVDEQERSTIKQAIGQQGRSTGRRGLRTAFILCSFFFVFLFLVTLILLLASERDERVSQQGQLCHPIMSQPSIPVHAALLAVADQESKQQEAFATGSQRSQSLPPPALPRPPKRRTQEYTRSGAEAGYEPAESKLTTFSGTNLSNGVEANRHDQAASDPVVRTEDWQQGRFWSSHTDAPLSKAEEQEVIDRVKQDQVGGEVTVTFSRGDVDQAQQQTQHHNGASAREQDQQHVEHSLPSVQAIADAAHLSLLELQAAVSGSNLFQQMPQQVPQQMPQPTNASNDASQQANIPVWPPLPALPQTGSGPYANPYAIPPPPTHQQQQQQGSSQQGRQTYYNSQVGNFDQRNRYYDQRSMQGSSFPLFHSIHFRAHQRQAGEIEVQPSDQFIASNLEEQVTAQLKRPNEASGSNSVGQDEAERPKKRTRKPRQPRDGEQTYVRCNIVAPATGQECGLLFKRAYDLLRHKQTVHAETGQKKDWACGQCGSSFSRKDALLRHCRIRSHESGL